MLVVSCFLFKSFTFKNGKRASIQIPQNRIGAKKILFNQFRFYYINDTNVPIKHYRNSLEYDLNAIFN